MQNQKVAPREVQEGTACLKIKFPKLVFFAIVFFIASVNCFDQPQFYRVPLFQSIPTKAVQDWRTTVQARIGDGSTNSAYDSHEHKTALLSAYGLWDVLRLGRNLENITTKIQTYLLWGTAGAWKDPDTIVPALAPLDGKIDVSGHFHLTELDLSLQQNLLWGFYAQVYAPLKWIKIDKITPTNRGAAAVNGINVANFLTTTLPTILKENGFKPFDSRFKKSGIGDLAINVGWQAHKDQSGKMIKSIGGMVQAGVIVPTGAERDEDLVVAVPLGYNGHVGYSARGALEIGLWDIVTLGAQFGSTIFSTCDQKRRLVTDKKQQGWLYLEKGFVRVDQGSIWDLGAYAKFDQLGNGIAIVAGYSFTRQEESSLFVRDANYLKTASKAAADAALNAPYPPLISPNDYANADVRLDGWQYQALHLAIWYDATVDAKKKWAPIVKLEYAYPINGRYSFATDMFAGSLGLSFSFNI